MSWLKTAGPRRDVGDFPSVLNFLEVSRAVNSLDNTDKQTDGRTDRRSECNAAY